MALAALVATAVGSMVAAGGAVYSGMAAKNQAEYQAAVARNNEVLASRQASYERQTGEIEAVNAGAKTKAMLGAETASQGASGIALGEGTPETLRENTQALGTLDQLTIRSNAERRAYAATLQGYNAANEANLRKMQGEAGMTAGFINAGGNLLSGASSFGDKWASFQTKGLLT